MSEPTPERAALTELAPTGELRVALVVSNPNIASKDAASGEVSGVAVELARQVAGRLGVFFRPIEYVTVTDMMTGLKAGAWDLVFFGIDPTRATVLDFGPTYLEIDQTYLVPAGSPIKTAADVDQAGIRVAVPKGFIPDAFLSRELQCAQIIRLDWRDDALEMLRSGQIDAYGSDRGGLLDLGARLPGSRVLEDSFLINRHAVAVPRGRTVGLAYAGAVVEQAKASGLVAEAVRCAGLIGVRVAPPATRGSPATC